MTAPKIIAGASGFAYKPWKGPFYPEDLPVSEMLSYYAGQLPAVEINNTFYRMPKATVMEDWAAKTPAAFTFAVKASRRITHCLPPQGRRRARGVPVQEPRRAW